jgi:ferric-dicitrate binding protein FerR (iron transport regulator)
MNRHDWESVIGRHLDGIASAEEIAALSEKLESDADTRLLYLRLAGIHATLATGELDEPASGEAEDQLLDLVEQLESSRKQQRGRRTVLSVVAVVATVTLIAGIYFWRPSEEPQIATISGVSGSLVWTGDGGRVVEDLSVGTKLTGGTVEGLTPSSWVELKFADRSTVMISGNSRLTFSDHGQKKLQLKEGTFSANVKPQPPGRPMLLQTRTATIEVLGTQFNVDAGLFSTTLNVSEGKVRVKRLSDGSKVDVPAGHRVIVAPDRQMSLTVVPTSINAWKSQLHLGAGGSLGRWSPGAPGEGPQLEAVPYTTRSTGKTIYSVAFGVSNGDTPPVVLQPDSIIRIRGHIRSKHKVYFGTTVRQANGDFAGRFQIVLPADEFQSGEVFEVVLQLTDFQLDSSLKHMQGRLPGAPFGLVVESIWCHTLYDSAGLAVTDVNLVAPEEPLQQ